MKFTINTKALLNSLKDVSRAISKKTTIPILTGAHIQASNKGLILTGSNADISIKLNVPVTKEDGLHVEKATDTDKSDGLVMPMPFFQKIVSSLPDKTMSLDQKEDFQVEITSGNSKFEINSLDGSNYPHLPKLATDDTFTLPAKSLSNAISDVVINASTQESRPLLTGVHLIAKDGWLNATSTDSHRLGSRSVKVAGLKKDFDVDIPATSLKELLSQMKGQTTVDVTLAESQAVFQFTDTTFYSRLLVGNYPDTSKIIPQSFSIRTIADKNLLLADLEQTALLSHASRNNVIKIAINKLGNVEITADSPDVGNAKERMTAKVQGDFKKKPFTIAMNPDYLIDALKKVPTNLVNISFIGALRPFVVQPNTDKDTHFVQLITPVRTF